MALTASRCTEPWAVYRDDGIPQVSILAAFVVARRAGHLEERRGDEPASRRFRHTHTPVACDQELSNTFGMIHRLYSFLVQGEWHVYRRRGAVRGGAVSNASHPGVA